MWWTSPHKTLNCGRFCRLAPFYLCFYFFFPNANLSRWIHLLARKKNSSLFWNILSADRIQSQHTRAQHTEQRYQSRPTVVIASYRVERKTWTGFSTSSRSTQSMPHSVYYSIAMWSASSYYISSQLCTMSGGTRVPVSFSCVASWWRFCCKFSSHNHLNIQLNDENDARYRRSACACLCVCVCSVPVNASWRSFLVVRKTFLALIDGAWTDLCACVWWIDDVLCKDLGSFFCTNSEFCCSILRSVYTLHAVS